MSDAVYQDNGLDLRYPELAYNMTDIFRPEPGTVPFYIPALYPFMSGGKVQTNVIKQKNSSLLNKDKPNISNINITNCINIQVPRELCGYLDKTHNVSGNLTIKGSTSGSMTINAPGHPVSGTMTGNETLTGSANGTLTFKAIDNTIKKGATWVVVFIGGDINKPVIISRCYV